MPKDNEVDEKVIEPVAVIYPDTGLRNDAAAMALWRNHGYDTGGEPLYSAATVAALEAEVAENEGVIAVWRRRCEEAERRVGELEAFVAAVRTECFDYWNEGVRPWPHHMQTLAWKADEVLKPAPTLTGAPA